MSMIFNRDILWDTASVVNGGRSNSLYKHFNEDRMPLVGVYRDGKIVAVAMLSFPDLYEDPSVSKKRLKLFPLKDKFNLTSIGVLKEIRFLSKGNLDRSEVLQELVKHASFLSALSGRCDSLIFNVKQKNQHFVRDMIFKGDVCRFDSGCVRQENGTSRIKIDYYTADLFRLYQSHIEDCYNQEKGANPYTTCYLIPERFAPDVKKNLALS